MSEGGGDREGAGAQELGRRVSQLAQQLSRSSRVARLPALRPNSGSPALAGPDAPAQRGEVEDGAALWAWAPPLRPREFPAPLRGAAPHSGGRGDSSGWSWVPGAGPGCEEGARTQLGAPYRGGDRGN